MNDALDDLLNDLLNDLCKTVQDRLDQDDGGFASHFWTGENLSDLHRLVGAYVSYELCHAGDDDDDPSRGECLDCGKVAALNVAFGSDDAERHICARCLSAFYDPEGHPKPFPMGQAAFVSKVVGVRIGPWTCCLDNMAGTLFWRPSPGLSLYATPNHEIEEGDTDSIVFSFIDAEDGLIDTPLANPTVRWTDDAGENVKTYLLAMEDFFTEMGG